MIRSNRTFMIVLYCLVFSLSIGCDRKTTVNGKVSCKGKPVVWGNVILIDANGEYHQGVIELDGSYTIVDVPKGIVKIGVSSPNPNATHNLKNRKPDPKADSTAKLDKPAKGAWFPIPDKYADPNSSGLTETVAGKPIVIDLN